MAQASPPNIDGSPGALYAIGLEHRDDLGALRDIPAPAWVGAAELRGTASILWSCILTISACVYTALHLNIPKKRGTWYQLFYKVRWMGAALFAPEVVVYVAARQFLEARWLQGKLRELIRENKALNEPKSLPFTNEDDISLDICFYVSMGALRVPGQHSDGISVGGYYYLARLGIYIPISAQMVADRSKANTLQKALVLLQVSWMVLGCAARTYLGLPVSLLEIHTMAHVLCAVIVYLFWFKKPLDIQEPDASDQLIEPAIRLLQVITDLPGDLATSLRDERYMITSDIASVPADEIAWKSSDTGPAFWIQQPRAASEPSLEHVADLANLASHLGRLMPESEPKEYPVIVSGPKDKILAGTEQQTSSPFMLLVDGTNFQTYSSKQINEGSYYALVDVLQVSRSSFILAAWTAVYAGLHLTAWNHEFPSETEAQIWRIACIGIGGFIPFLWISFIVLLPFLPLAEIIYDVLCLAVFVVGLVFVCLCRCYIVVESFLSLRHEPLGVFWSPSWLQAIPHI